MVKLKMSDGRDEARAHIPKRIFILAGGNSRRDSRLIGFPQIRAPRRMHVINRDHRNGRGNLELNIKAQADQQRGPSQLIMRVLISTIEFEA